jgi:hypothetical protein
VTPAGAVRSMIRAAASRAPQGSPVSGPSASQDYPARRDVPARRESPAPRPTARPLWRPAPRRVAVAFGLLAVLGALTGCQVHTSVSIDAGPGGSGTVAVSVSLDAAALSALGGQKALVEQLADTDLTKAGWVVIGPTPGPQLHDGHHGHAFLRGPGRGGRARRLDRRHRRHRRIGVHPAVPSPAVQPPQLLAHRNRADREGEPVLRAGVLR